MATADDIANRVAITGALILCTLMNTLDSTIVNVALPHMRGELGASQDQITWALTSYIIANAFMTPLGGWLSLKFGRKPMMLASIVGFTLASVACGVAQNLPEIVVFRFLQGVAGASMMPLSQGIMLDLFPLSMIPQVMSIWSAAVIVGPILGPVVGGWLTESQSWRWCFYINVPIGVLAFAGIYTFMSHDRGGRQRPFDFIGFGALVAFIGAFQLMMDRGPDQDWFDSAEIWTYVLICMISGYVFVLQTITARHPFFHRDLAKDRNFVASTLFGLGVGVLLFSTTALLPTFMQSLLGYSALESGYAQMPRGVGSLVAFLIVPYLVNYVGPRRVLALGVILSAVALWQMAQFDLTMTATPIMVSGVIQGFGTGLLFAPLNVLAYATLAPHHRTEGTIVSTIARSLGSAAGISVMQAGLVRLTAQNHQMLAGDLDPASPVVRSAFGSALDSANPEGLEALNGEVTRQASMIGYDAVFAWMALGILLLLPLMLVMQAQRKATALSATELVAD